MNTKNFKRIVFYSSETCNLNCKYCVLSKSSNKDYHIKFYTVTTKNESAVKKTATKKAERKSFSYLVYFA